jgi:hypothetical protein
MESLAVFDQKMHERLTVAEARVAELMKQLERERTKRLELELAFALSDAALPDDFEPDLPPTKRLYAYIEHWKSKALA